MCKVAVKQWCAFATKVRTSADEFAHKLVEQAMREESLGKIEVQRARVVRGKILFIVWKRGQQRWNQIALFIRTLSCNILESSYQAIRLHHTQKVMPLGFIHILKHVISKERYQLSFFFKRCPHLSKIRHLGEGSTYKETC